MKSSSRIRKPRKRESNGRRQRINKSIIEAFACISCPPSKRSISMDISISINLPRTSMARRISVKQRPSILPEPVVEGRAGPTPRKSHVRWANRYAHKGDGQVDVGSMDISETWRLSGQAHSLVGDCAASEGRFSHRYVPAGIGGGFGEWLRFRGYACMHERCNAESRESDQENCVTKKSSAKAGEF